MPDLDKNQGYCQGISFYRSRHRAIRRLKRLHSPQYHGHRVWTSSWLLMDYLKTLRLAPGLKVMEVGCGWGLAGIFCARILEAATTCLDSDPQVFPFLRLHAELNQVKIITQQKRFEDLSTQDLAGLDLLIGADICFWDELQAPLSALLGRAREAGVGTVLLADPGRDTFERLAAEARDRFNGTTYTFSVQRPHPIQGRIVRINN